MKTKQILLYLFFALTGFTFSVNAQSEDDNVKACINNYLEGVTKGDTSRLNKAFHPTAMLRSINSVNGRLYDIPVRNFIAKTPAGGVQATTKIVSYAYIGISALATVELQFADFKYVDLLSMLKFGNEWRIVTRVFSKADLGDNIKGVGVGNGAATASAQKTPGKKPSSANVKPKSDDGW
ncbi:nuclear transport factor 2 family protein [Pseudarcicella hirudinis]|nr:nuclear transport factor 2 family protein [Pseudarcicella hirudinis]